MSRRSMWTLSLAVAITAAFSTPAFAGCGACGGDAHGSKAAHTHPKHASMDIVDMAAHTGTFNTLVAAVKAAGLVETLKGEGPFTVFAPSDEAFAKLPAGTIESLLEPANKGKLQSILTYHVVPGKVLAKDVVALQSAKTVEGSKVRIKTANGAVMVDNATVVKTDITTTNGVIHVIDSVIMPN